MEKNMATTLRYAKGESALGPFVAAISGQGLAMLEFGELTPAIRAGLAARFPDATLVEDPAALADLLPRLVDLIARPCNDHEILLDLRGTEFELRVWEALRRIPAGKTASYGEIAAQLGTPRLAREVAEACAANMLAVVVPCHRVVKKDGSISGYRWGFRRKRELLAREAGEKNEDMDGYPDRGGVDRGTADLFGLGTVSCANG
jgi:AraC family transcriptional regulator of adaptative response/methylated-DNA-[protein]-cysteine methyltransferase